MALNRYYNQNALVQGAAEWLAGFGQRRQQMQMAEAQMQAQQNQMAAQAIGGGLNQGIGNAIQLTNQRQLADLQMRNQLAVANARYGGSPEQQNQLSGYMNDIFGASPVSPDVVTGPSVAQQDAAGVFGPPSVAGPQIQPPMTDTGVPAPMIDPSVLPEYRQNQEKLARYTTMAEDIATSARSIEEKNAMLGALAPEIQRLRSFVGRHPAPKPPSTYEEVVQQGGAIPIPGTYNYLVPDPKNGGFKVSTAVHPVSEQSAPPITITSGDGTTQVVDVPPGGVSILPNGMVIRRNAKGDPDVEWPPSANTTKPPPPLSFDKARSMAIKEADALYPSALTTNPEKVKAKQDFIERKTEEFMRRGGATQQTQLNAPTTDPRHEALMERSTELIGMGNTDNLAVPMVDAWTQNAVTVYGRDVDKWPDDVQRAFDHLRWAVWDKRKNQLTVTR